MGLKIIFALLLSITGWGIALSAGALLLGHFELLVFFLPVTGAMLLLACLVYPAIPGNECPEMTRTLSPTAIQDD